MTDARKTNKIIIWIMIVLLAVTVIVAVVNLMQYNQNKREIERLNAEKDSKQYQVDEKNDRLNSAMDDDYIEDAAREHGYCNPEDVIIYGDVMN